MATNKTLLELENRLTKSYDSLSGSPSFRWPFDPVKIDELNSKLQGYVTVIPEPGMCIKMKTTDGKKVFINVCFSEKVPPLDQDLTEADLAERLQSSAESMRIPMSVGDPHDEVDHSGEPCRVYDIVVHPSLYQKIEKSELFYHFFISVGMEALENKFSLAIDRRSAVTLKGKRFFGKIVEQRVRTKPKLVQEIQNHPVSVLTQPRVPLESGSNNYSVPYSELWMDPEGCKTRHLKVEISLGNVNDLKQISLAVGDDRILLTSSSVKPKNYRLEIGLPVQIAPQQAAAVFKLSTKMLVIGLPIV
ncbi:PIH1 domain-containing protein 1-like [Paramacrobiotus metropolitanus]|uniref:PIH1 domain-containing protein 1-like n=1 Tax=Paramacrobiotus metropolitanus TaxID=2943436 RepID=UPI00244581FD|nr:PIH1 domain-containing protein 1-like [Paramacrobiotus metropolitanus]